MERPTHLRVSLSDVQKYFFLEVILLFSRILVINLAILILLSGDQRCIVVRVIFLFRVKSLTYALNEKK